MPAVPGDVFAKIARNTAARYRGIAEADDVEQELWLWWLSHGEPDLKEMDWAMTRTLYTVAERYCKKEKVARLGPDEKYVAQEVLELVVLLVNPPSDDLSGFVEPELKAAVAALPAELKDALVSHAEGESFRSIAERSGLSVSTAHRRVRLALDAVAKTLNGEA